jgi:hypothetical protein
MINDSVRLLPLTEFACLSAKLDDTDLKPIKEEIDEIKVNFEKASTANHYLVGHIDKEYELVKSKEHITKLLMPLIQYYEENNPILEEGCSKVKGDFKLALDNVWVNFMKKYEYNPPHQHSGVFSFVLWIDIPFKIEDEISKCKNIKSNPGSFNFINYSPTGKLKIGTIQADKTYNGSLIIFPADLHHFVNPFYTSNKYRISVSGNLVLVPTEEEEVNASNS